MKQTALNVREMALDDLKPAAYNPRVELQPGDPEYEAIKRSIEEFGYVDPIIANADGTIIGGHQRYNVLRDLGYQTAHVVLVDLDANQERALNIALNKLSGDWDDAKLYELLADLDLNGYDFTVTGFNQDDLDLGRVQVGEEAHDDGFDPDKAGPDYSSITGYQTKPGDMWQLGQHRILCGDATNPDHVQRLLQGDELDLVITDPPYNVDIGGKLAFLENYRKGSGRESDDLTNDAMKNLDTFQAFLQSAFVNAFDVMRPGAAIYVFYAEGNGLQFRQAYHNAGLKMAEHLVWVKNMFVLGLQDYQWRHEPIIYGWKPGAAHYFIKDRSQDTIWEDDAINPKEMSKGELVAFVEKLLRRNEYLTTVLYHDKPMSSPLHTTMKPVPLVGKLMTNSSRPGWIVGDFFCGSGTTLVAAEQLGRQCRAIEIEPHNVDAIVRRWEEMTGQAGVPLQG